jgi:hypothetical protein
MPTEDKTQKEEKTTPKIEQNYIYPEAKDFRTFYTNFIQASNSPFDISLMLMDNTGFADESGKYVVERQARVVMTPAEAQNLIKIVSSIIESYEKTWGPIVPPQLQVKKTEGS